MSIRLPTDYLAYMQHREPWEGFTQEGSEPGYVVLWSLAQIGEFNVDVEIEKYAPEFIGFGGNGGGDLLAFNSDGAVFLLPMIGLAPDEAVRIANTFNELVARLVGAV